MTQRVVYSWTIRLQVRAGCLNYRSVRLCAPASVVRPCMRTAYPWPALAQPKLPPLLADLAHTSKQLWPPKAKATALPPLPPLPPCNGEQECPKLASCRSLPDSQLPLLAPQAAPPLYATAGRGGGAGAGQLLADRGGAAHLPKPVWRQAVRGSPCVALASGCGSLSTLPRVH